MRRSSLALLLLVSTLAAGCYSRELPSDEIHELYSGATVRGRHLLDGYSFEREFDANGTFIQTHGPTGSGSWMVRYDSICISWDRGHAKAGRQMCRAVRTDDKGRYWKVLVKRNGKEVKVVRYTAFTGPDGADRRRIPGTVERWRRWMSTWRGLVVVALLAVVLFFGLRRLVRTWDKPLSTRNRLRRRLFGVKAGDLKYSYGALQGLDETRQLELLDACVRQSRWIEVYWIVEVICNKATRQQGIATCWRCFAELDDVMAERAVIAALPFFEDDKVNIAATDGDSRCAYVIGKAFMTEASSLQRTDQLTFERYKQISLAHFEHVRSKEPAPPPEVTAAADPYRGSPSEPSTADNYAALVGPLYESMMYMNFIAPAKKSRSYSSSGYSGGG